jgi:hypothetical protein
MFWEKETYSSVLFTQHLLIPPQSIPVIVVPIPEKPFARNRQKVLQKSLYRKEKLFNTPKALS